MELEKGAGGRGSNYGMMNLATWPAAAAAAHVARREERPQWQP